MRDDSLLLLFTTLAPFSLTAFGGGVAVVTGVQHETVEVLGLLSSQEFLNYFAISRAAPGPGSFYTSLIGWHVAGLPGAIVATVAMFLPSSILCALVAILWKRYQDRQWLVTLEQAVTPIGVGLLIAALLTLIPIAATTWVLAAILVLSATAALALPKLHPLIILAAGAAASVGASALLPIAGIS